MTIKALFLQAIQYPEPIPAGSLQKQRKPYTSIEEFFHYEGSRERQTITYGNTRFFFWMTGIRPINLVVAIEENGVEKREIVGFFAD